MISAWDVCTLKDLAPGDLFSFATFPEEEYILISNEWDLRPAGRGAAPVRVISVVGGVGIIIITRYTLDTRVYVFSSLRWRVDLSHELTQD